MKRLAQYFAGLGRITAHRVDRGERMRTILLAVAALVVAYLAALQIKVALPHRGDTWAWTAGLWIVFQFIFIAPYLLWMEAQKKVEHFEEEARPKLFVSDPIAIVEPKGSAGEDVHSREYRLRITNKSTSVVRGCYVKMASLVNANGHESDVLNIRFKRSIDQPLVIQGFDHPQSFDLPPQSDEIVSICGTNKNVDPSAQLVIMLYAIHGAGGAGIRNAIPRQLFPHILALEIGAENLVHPVRRRYRLSFDSEGIFRMEKIES